MTAEQSIIQMLNNKIKEHEAKINSFRAAIKAIGGAASSAPSVTINRSEEKAIKKVRRKRRKRSKTPILTVVKQAVPKAVAVKKTAPAPKPAVKKNVVKKSAKVNNEPTFESVVLGLLNDGVPKTSKSLLQLYNKATGKKLDSKGFSARLAIAKNRKNILSVTNPADTFLYNGKAAWFEGGKMKKDFLDKLPS